MRSSVPALTVVLAEVDSLFRLGARNVLGADPLIHIAGESSDGAEAVGLVRRQRPDVLLLDVQIRGIGALEVLSKVRALDVGTKPVLVVQDLDRPTLEAAILRGARGTFRKDLSADLLLKCIRRVAAGEFWIGRDMVAHLVDAMRHERLAPPHSGLTPRDLDVVTSLVNGASNKDIARALGLTEQSVKNQLRRIFARLSVSNRVELAQCAVSRGLLGPASAGAVNSAKPMR